MEKAKFMGKLTFDYRKFMSNSDYKEFKQDMLDFLKKHKNLPDNEFLDKLNSDVPLIRFYNEGISRHYLSKIAADVSTLKIIVLVFAIISAFAAIALFMQ